MKKICGNCAFWQSNNPPTATLGECHRYPPQITADSETFPETISDERCGEFKEKKPPIFHEGVGIYDDPDIETKYQRPDDLLAREVIGRIVEFNSTLERHNLDTLTGLSFSPLTWNVLLQSPGFAMNIYASEYRPKSVCGVPIRVEKKK